MKASELIVKVQELMQEYGDIEVRAYVPETEYETEYHKDIYDIQYFAQGPVVVSDPFISI